MGCFAEFTLSKLRGFFSRDCGIKMTGEGRRMTANRLSMIALTCSLPRLHQEFGSDRLRVLIEA
jgi:hypothetical protein